MKFRQSAIVLRGSFGLAAVFACALVISTFTAPVTVSAQKDTSTVSDEASVVSVPSSIPDSPAGSAIQHVVDMNGDGKTDFSVIRNAGPAAQATWYTQYNGAAGSQIVNWGLGEDNFIPGDFDGDNKSDVAVWRAGPAGTAAWYILQSQTSTVRVDTFGQTGDDPSVVGDYNNDGKDDVAVYRFGTWYWRQAVGGQVFVVQWGLSGDFPAPGDYDGDGKNDFCIQRQGASQANFWTLFTTGGNSVVGFGLSSDLVVPGDYDGDGKTDIATVRVSGSALSWFVRPSTNPSTYTQTFWGLAASDIPAQGDYDGDGKTDQAIWRSSTTPGLSAFYVNGSLTGFQVFAWGVGDDLPLAAYNTH